MLKVTLFEFLIRGIPEGFLFILANYAFAKTKIVPFPFLFSSVTLILFTYGVRFLPINFGVHTVLNLIGLVLLCIFINKIDLFTAVKGSMFAMLLMVFIEAINVLILQLIFGDGLSAIIEDSFRKALAGTPGFVVYGIIVIVLYFFLTREKKDRGENGTISEQSSK